MSVESKESHLRSILKAITWRILATTTTFLIAYFVTGESIVAFTIASFETIAKLAIYYFHERAWQMVPRQTIRGLLKGGTIAGKDHP
ncbi:MAG: DUF2061 domain-containing protein [Gammaproteobacteria bacterium]|nr:DUF2061 domain-containing protein [Gammaproteobacteria bacterium]NNJ84576.1 DUF2061 domain-containing protein [Gammaproteobacteria bacterium]